MLGNRIYQPQDIALYSDVDGTLIGSNGEVNEDLVQAIREFVDAGFGFTFATGRNLRAVKRILQQIPVTLPLVLCNGSYVYDEMMDRARWWALSRSVVREIVPLLLEIPNTRIHVECSDSSLWTTDTHFRKDPYIRKEGLNPHVFLELEEVFQHGEVLKLGVKLMEHTASLESRLTALTTYLSSALPFDVNWCFSSSDYLEIMRADTSKWTGILQSQELHGNRHKMIVTVGDHHNDIEMIRYADLGFAMNNAVAAVKEIAVDCVGHVDDDGIVPLLTAIRSGDIPLKKIG